MSIQRHLIYAARGHDLEFNVANKTEDAGSPNQGRMVFESEPIWGTAKWKWITTQCINDWNCFPSILSLDGKIGNKGRQCPEKVHPDQARALKFAQRQVNVKIMLGWVHFVIYLPFLLFHNAVHLQNSLVMHQVFRSTSVRISLDETFVICEEIQSFETNAAAICETTFKEPSKKEREYKKAFSSVYPDIISKCSCRWHSRSSLFFKEGFHQSENSVHVA